MDFESLLRLGRRVGALEDQVLARAFPLAALREGFLVRSSALRRRGRLEKTLWIAAAVVLLSVGAGVGAGALLAPAPLAARVRNDPVSADTWVRSEQNEQVPIDFSDGSRFVLEPGSRARIAELRPDGATLAIESGGVDVSVVHRERTSFRLNLGPFAVRVTGTRFSVNWRPEQDKFQLSLREGSVVVSGCGLGEPRPLRAGEVLSASCRDGRFEISRGQVASAGPSVPAAEAEAEPSAGAAEPEQESRAGALPAAAEPEWRALARSGEFQGALARLSGSRFEAACERAGAADLALLADVARFAGDPQRALGALSALRRRFPGTGRATSAAFTIARIHFDQRGAYDEAARWFRAYLTEQPRGPLSREAQGRLMEALYRSGDRDGAARVAEQYLGANPSGPHARLARSLTAR